MSDWPHFIYLSIISELHYSWIVGGRKQGAGGAWGGAKSGEGGRTILDASRKGDENYWTSPEGAGQPYS